MAASRRELILANVATTLAGISVGAGYQHDLDQVLRGTQAVRTFLGTSTNAKTITLWVRQTSEQALDEGDQNKITRRLSFNIGILLRHEPAVDGLNTETLMNEISQDIYRAMMVDESRGGIAWGFKGLESQDRDELDDVGSGLIREEQWSYIYTHSITDESVA